jgi:hypothetical protein
LYGDGNEQPEGDPGRVEGDVERRGVPASHEVLVNLVRDRVDDAQHKRRRLAPDRTQGQGAEDRVLGQVRALAEDLVPHAEAGRERRDRGERKDHRRPRDNRPPKRESTRHLAMIGSAPIGER